MATGWLAAALAAVREAAAESRVGVFLQHVYNELHHGSGQTDPRGIGDALVEGADEIRDALSGRPAAGLEESAEDGPAEVQVGSGTVEFDESEGPAEKR